VTNRTSKGERGEDAAGAVVSASLSGRLSRRELGRRGALAGVSAAARAVALRSAGFMGGGAALAGFARAGAQPAEGQGGTLNFSSTGGDSGMGNPILTGGTAELLFWFCHQRLVNFSDTGEIVPELADSWTFNADGTELTFKLNPAARWHDDTPVTSADVLFTFDKIKDPATKTTLGSRLQVAGEFATWASPDPQTVVLTVAEPYAPFLAAFVNIGIIPKHLLERSSDLNTDPYNQAPVGCGPWRVTEWQVDQFVRFEPHTAYHGGPPRADALNVLHFESDQAAFASLETGEVDFAFAVPQSQSQYEDNPDFRLLRYVYFMPVTLSFNFKHPILADLRVRQAIRLGINKDDLAATLTRGRDPRADHLYADEGPHDRFNDDALPPDEFDLARANALLDEAGYLPGDDGIRAKDGQRMSFPLLTYNAFEEYRSATEVLQQMLGELGIEVTPEVLDYDALEAKWSDPDDDPLTRPLTVEEYPHALEQDPDIYNELHSSAFPPAGRNYNYVDDPELDRLLDLGRTTLDAEARVPIYQQLDARCREVIPAIPLYLVSDSWVVNAAVGGYDPETPSSRWLIRSASAAMFKAE
jgi:peptide/nickel transport system substrate-binding protein